FDQVPHVDQARQFQGDLCAECLHFDDDDAVNRDCGIINRVWVRLMADKFLELSRKRGGDMSKAVKSLMMKDLSDQLRGVSEVVFVDISKLDGVANNRLRIASRKQSISLLGTPFKLARRVLLDLGWKLERQAGGP